MVATDFSDSAREALESAVALFPRAAMAVLHSYRPAVDQLAQSQLADDARRQLAADACARFLAESALSQDNVARLQLLLENGSVESLVKSYAHDKGLDLLVIGSHGRSAVADLLLGSTAAKLLASAPCDVLVVRKTSASAKPDAKSEHSVVQAD